MNRRRELELRIANVARVLRDWDPLGVEPGVAAPADEYDGYAPALTERVLGGTSVEELAAHLKELREQMLGQVREPDDDDAVAARILEAASAPVQRESGERASKRAAASVDEGSYTCPSCGESIVVPLDPSEGAEQRYVEDCPVCCRANVIHVEFFDDGSPPRVDAEAE